MKICGECGAHNSDERMFCIDCDEKLDGKLSDADEEKMRETVNENIEKLYNKRDPLYVSLFDRIMGIASLAGAAVTLVLMIVDTVTRLNFEQLWVGALFLVMASVEALVPRVTWSLEQLRLSFSISNVEEAEPSDFYLFFRKAGIVVSVTVGMAILVINFL